jgi:glyoxylase-like metal-dependent hydrolase (beta-lactamase superfamily II)
MFIEDVEFNELEGDAEILPGIRAVFTPGHSPGCQAVIVETQQGPAAITGFCCNKENFPERGPAICPGVHTDAIAAYDSIQKIKQMGGIILPMHELELKPIT